MRIAFGAILHPVNRNPDGTTQPGIMSRLRTARSIADHFARQTVKRHGISDGGNIRAVHAETEAPFVQNALADALTVLDAEGRPLVLTGPHNRTFREMLEEDVHLISAHRRISELNAELRTLQEQLEAEKAGMKARYRQLLDHFLKASAGDVREVPCGEVQDNGELRLLDRLGQADPNRPSTGKLTTEGEFMPFPVEPARQPAGLLQRLRKLLTGRTA